MSILDDLATEIATSIHAQGGRLVSDRSGYVVIAPNGQGDALVNTVLTHLVARVAVAARNMQPAPQPTQPASAPQPGQIAEQAGTPAAPTPAPAPAPPPPPPAPPPASPGMGLCVTCGKEVPQAMLIPHLMSGCKIP